MSIVIDIPHDLEQKLRATASAAGENIDEYIVKLLEKNVQEKVLDPSSSATGLLQIINRGLSPEAWARFHNLLQKRDTQVITATELEELIDLTEAIEVAHAQRMEALVALATLQNKPLPVLMNELGIGPVAYDADEEN
jgi:Glu-tRNA(Gln) amidotransferase subunit E-like FAD-binding protein